MSAYVIVEVSIHDHKDYEEYKKLTPAAIAAFDGKFIVRGGKTTYTGRRLESGENRCFGISFGGQGK